MSQIGIPLHDFLHENPPDISHSGHAKYFIMSTQTTIRRENYARTSDCRSIPRSAKASVKFQVPTNGR